MAEKPTDSKNKSNFSSFKKKPKSGAEHPSGMTSFEAIILILKQPGVSPSTKTLWIHMTISGWTTGKAYISEYKTPRAVGISLRKIRQAVFFLKVRGLIDVERGRRAHTIRCNDALKRLADLPQALDWNAIHGGSSICIRAQIEMQIDQTAEPCRICTDQSCDMYQYLHNEPMQNLHGSDDKESLDPCKKCTGLEDQPMQKMHSTHAENAPQPCKICIQKEILNKDIKERTVTDETCNPRIVELAQIEDNLSDWQSRVSGGINVHREFQQFKGWLFGSPEGQAQQNVTKAWEDHLNRVWHELLDAEDEPEPKLDDDLFCVGK